MQRERGKKGGKMGKKWVKGAFKRKGQRERERGRRCGVLRGKMVKWEGRRKVCAISRLDCL